jgi:hypothetical protein
MARPFLADPELLNKAARGDERLINTCIGCNQACLDHTFQAKQASCLVNPRAGYETSLNYVPVPPGQQQRIAVVGAGPAGLAAATVAAQRGHSVTLYDSAAQIGGQFNLAKRIPGKEEFYETIRYFKNMLSETKARPRTVHAPSKHRPHTGCGVSAHRPHTVRVVSVHCPCGVPALSAWCPCTVRVVSAPCLRRGRG